MQRIIANKPFSINQNRMLQRDVLGLNFLSLFHGIIPPNWPIYPYS